MMGDVSSVMRSWNVSGMCDRLWMETVSHAAHNEYTQDAVPCCREDTHELLEGLERFTKCEVYVHLIEFFEVGRERREVERVVPLPRRRLST